MKLLMVLEQEDVSNAFRMHGAYSQEPLNAKRIKTTLSPFVRVCFEDRQHEKETIDIVSRYCNYIGADLINIVVMPDNNAKDFETDYLFTVEGWCKEDEQPDDTGRIEIPSNRNRLDPQSDQS